MRWLHISDVHYNPDMDGSVSKQLREQLPNYLQQVVKQFGDHVDEVFVTGDFRHARFQEDSDAVADASVALVCKIAASVGVDNQHIHIVPGNHDLTRFSDQTDKQKLNRIRKAYKVNNGRFQPYDIAWLLGRFSFFKRVSNKIHSTNPVWSDNLQPTHTYRCFNDYSILYMNTAVVCNKNNDRGRLIICNDDLRTALEKIKLENPNAPIIVLAHHSPMLFIEHECEAVEKMLGDYGVKLYLCGDAHDIWFRQINQTVEITMGCIREGDGEQATFSVGELRPDGYLSVHAHRWDSRMGGWGPYTQFDENIKKALPQLPLKPALPINNLDERNHHFSGRVKKLNEIHTAFKSGSAVCVKQAIAGLGGVGKTQLALEYAYRFGHEYTDAIWWVNAEKSPKNDLVEFSIRFGVIPEGIEAAMNMKDEDFIGRLRNWCNRHKSFLFIFDNVEVVDDVRPFISNIKNGHTLITTRDRRLNLHKTKAIELDVFDMKEARAFMLKRLPANAIGEKETLDKLIEVLGRLPLALEQALAYIADKDTNCNCEGYLSLLEQHGLEIFESEAARLEDYDDIVTTTWNISFDKLSQPARQLFYLCAYLAPDNIPLDFFAQRNGILPPPLNDELSNKLKTNEVILNLTKYALVKRTGNLLNIHRLVQVVTRRNQKGNTQWLYYCLNQAYAIFGYEWGNAQSMKLFGRMLPHVLELAHYADDELSEDEDAQVKIAWLYDMVGFGLDYSAQYEKALEWYHKALSIREKVLGREHPDTSTTCNNIANTYDNQGNYSKALEWFQQVLVVREKVLGTEHPDTITTYNNIANVYDNQGYYSKALEWFQKVLPIREKLLGKEHPDTGKTYFGIAGVFYSQGDYAKALEWYQKDLIICEKVLGKEHPDTAMTYMAIANVLNCHGDYKKALEWNYKALVVFVKVLGTEHLRTAYAYDNIADIYYRQGNYTKALELYNMDIAISERVLGTEHPYTATTYDSVAYVYYCMGDYFQALKFYQKALAIREKGLGKRHPDTAATNIGIANVYCTQGKFSKSMELYQDALDIIEKVLGYNNLTTVAAYFSIANVYYCQGDYDKALEWYTKDLVISEKIGKELPNTATTYSSVAGVYDSQGDYHKAQEWYNKALAIRERVLGKEHPDTATTYNGIASVFSHQGKYPQALEWYQKALVIFEAALGKEHSDTACTYAGIADVLSHQENYSKAQAWYQKALAVYTKIFGKEHPDTVAIYNGIAKTLMHQGDDSDALEWYQKALAVAEKILGYEHPNTATTYNGIAEVLSHQENYPEALKWYKKALAIREKVLNKEHPDTAEVFSNIGDLYNNQGEVTIALEWYCRSFKIYLCTLGDTHPATIKVRKNMEAAYQHITLAEPFNQWLRRSFTV